MEQIIILLAAYNGSRYVEEMIDSILAQDYTNWKLILSDDGSTDHTPEILESYETRFPEKILFYRSGMRFGNAQNHFMHLLKKFQNDAPYLMFADQDDVWHSDKVRKTYEMMKKTEKSPEIPTMVHTDLRVVNQELEELFPSFVEMSSIRGTRMELKHLLVQNVVTGCTMMVNRALAELACSSMPQGEILMHDWWLALLAAACGNTGFLNEATIDYRQHGGNSVGAKNTRSLKYIVSRLKTYDMAENMHHTFLQAKQFHKCFSEFLSEEQRFQVTLYAQLAERGRFARRWAYVRHGYWKCGLYRQIAQLVFG